MSYSIISVWTNRYRATKYEGMVEHENAVSKSAQKSALLCTAKNLRAVKKKVTLNILPSSNHIIKSQCCQNS